MPKTSLPPWATLPDPAPYTTVQMLVTDGETLLLQHRSANVRSVPNVWSWPGGLHDIGETLVQCGIRELKEETGLVAERAVMIGAPYENIVHEGPKSWHWVIFPMAMKVKSFGAFVNKEPDKHDQIEFFSIHPPGHRFDFNMADFLAKFPFHSSFDTYARENACNIKQALRTVCDPARVNHLAAHRVVEVPK